MSEPPSKRSLFLSPAEWSGLRQKLADPFFADLAQKNARAVKLYDATRGESLIDALRDLAAAPDSLRTIAAGYRVVKGRLLRAAIALHVSEDESAWPFALETIDFLLQRDFWRPKLVGARIRHFDLKMGDILYDASFILDTFGARLDADRENRLIQLMIEDGLGAYLRGWDAQEWWRTANFNWGPATHGNAGLAALAIADIDPALSRKVLAHAREGLKYVIANLPLDGWWTEGAMYHTTMMGHLSDFVIALHRIEGDDLGLSKNPRWIDALEYRRYCLAPDGKVLNFSNCGPGTTEWFFPQIYWWAQHLDRPEWTTFEDSICKKWSDTHGVFYDIEAFLYRPANPELPPLKSLAPLRHFRGLDWLTWRGPQTWLAFRAGNNGGNHNNFDLGHFILGRGETRFLVDPGYGAARTSQHNTVTIHGKDQVEASNAVIVRHGELPGGMFLCCDLRECAPYILEYHFRYLVLLGDAHLFVIDHLHGKGDRRVGSKYHFQSNLPVEATSDGCRVEGPGQDLAIASLTAHDPVELKPWKGPDYELTEISFISAADLVDELSVFRLSFDESRAPVFQLAADRQAITLTWNKATAVLDLKNRTVESSAPGEVKPG